MPSPLQAAGAVPDKQSKYAPIHVNRMWTGLWTNRSPLRDAATPYLYEKFYSGSRFDSLIDGLNTEISPRLTLTRRPGLVVYNSQTFSAIDDFYSFHTFDGKSNTEGIRVIADTATAVYDATGPSTKTLLFTKSSGAGQSFFQSVGNTLYFGNGVDVKKWVWAPAWVANTDYSAGDVILDSNNNLQRCLGYTVFPKFTTMTSNVLRVDYGGNGQVNIGDSVAFTNFTVADFLNGLTLTITNALYSPGTGQVWFECSITHGDYGSTAETSGLIFDSSQTGVSASSTTVFNSGVGDTTIDNTLGWVCKGNSVQNWGIVAPTSAPTVANTANTNAGSAWAATTFYNPSVVIVDSNTNIQLLTTSGTTGVGVPVWATVVGNVTADGTANWTCQGTATRATSHAYAAGTYISVTYYIYYTYFIPPTGPPWIPTQATGTAGPYTAFFKCTIAGTSASTATASMTWTGGVGSQIQDGTVTWKNIGTQITRTAAALSTTNITNSTAVTTTIQIVDAAGNFQNILTAGISGSSAPTFATTVGATTNEAAAGHGGTAIWSCGGPATSANTLQWFYGYAYKNSVTGHISSCSPASTPIILAATSYITVSGAGSTDEQVDTIQIYRSTLQTTATTAPPALFLIGETLAPLNGGSWSYSDFSPDPPSVLSTLNEFVSADLVANNAPPPDGLVTLAYHLNRIFGVVGEFVDYSLPPNASIGVAAESFPGSNFMQTPATTKKLWPNALGILLFTLKGVLLSNGTDSSGLPSTPVPFTDDISLASANCFTVNGSTPIMFTSDKQFLSMDPSAGFSRVGFAIEDILQGFSSTASYATWHTNGPDQALYIADGSANWYRCNLTPAPETGSYTWSPKAVITGGMKCVKSVETSIGTRQLLVGPTSSGEILARDTSVSTDNGSAYVADATVGNIVLAQPGACAEVDFITTESLKIGSDVTVSILPGEVSGTFEPLQVSQEDPTFLAPSTTLYSSRWYFNQLLKTPGWMRHMQVQFSWPNEAFVNEMLTYTIYGCVHEEL